MNELISIIVPCYNSEKYLERCVYSLINQTIKNIEIILINDGSTDKTGELCEYYANLDKRIKVIHKKNEGVAYARNTGIDFATGKYIGFVDSDDFVELDMYEILYSAMISNDADISQCSYNRVEGKKIIPINKTQNNIILNNEDGMKNVIDATIFFPAVWNKLYKRNIIKTYFRSFRLCEDRIFNIETFINAKKSIYVDICKYNYVNNVGSLVNVDYSKKNLDVLLGNRYITEFVALHYPKLEKYTLKNEFVESIVQLGSIYYFNLEHNFADDIDNIIIRLKQISKKCLKYNILPKKYLIFIIMVYGNKKIFTNIIKFLFNISLGTS